MEGRHGLLERSGVETPDIEMHDSVQIYEEEAKPVTSLDVMKTGETMVVVGNFNILEQDKFDKTEMEDN